MDFETKIKSFKAILVKRFLEPLQANGKPCHAISIKQQTYTSFLVPTNPK